MSSMPILRRAESRNLTMKGMGVKMIKQSVIKSLIAKAYMYLKVLMHLPIVSASAV